MGAPTRFNQAIHNSLILFINKYSALLSVEHPDLVYTSVFPAPPFPNLDIERNNRWGGRKARCAHLSASKRKHRFLILRCFPASSQAPTFHIRHASQDRVINFE